MKYLILIILPFALSSCSIEKFFPGRVADGAARLTVNNFGKLVIAITSLPSSDPRPECNLVIPPFSGEGIVTPGKKDGLGKATWRFADCVYDFGTGTEVKSQSQSTCPETTTRFFGKVVISGTRTISGILTGNKDLPVIPSGPEGIEFEFERVTFENYRVETEGQENVMTNNSGSLSYKAVVHLGKENQFNSCMVPLPNLTLSKMRYSPQAGAAESIVTLPGFLGDFQAAINNSDFQAQVGVYQPEGQAEIRNQLRGTLTVWGNKINVPSDDSGRLDPSLTPDAAMQAYNSDLKCIGNLDQKAAGYCKFEEEAATLVGQLTINNLGRLLSVIAAKDSFPSTPARGECKLSSLERPSLVTAKVEEEGYVLGDVVWKFDNCVYDFGSTGTKFKDPTDKNAPEFTVFGKVTLSGERSIFGRITGNQFLPVEPKKGEMNFRFKNVSLENFRVEMPGVEGALTARRGALSFSVTVHLKRSGDRDVFQDPEPNLTFKEVQYQGNTDAVLSVKSGQFSGDFNLKVEGSDFRAQNGKFGEDENIIEGSLQMFGSSQRIRRQKLNPKAPSSLETEENQTSEKAGPDKVSAFFADNAARLSIFNAANLLGALVRHGYAPTDRQKRECFLEKLEVVEGKTTGASTASPEGKVVWEFANCTYDFGASGTQIRISKDPNVGETTFFGRVTISGRRIIEGYLTTNKSRPVVPSNGEYIFELDEIRFDNFRVEKPKFEYALDLISGVMSFRAVIHLDINPVTKLYMDAKENLTFENFKYASGSKVNASVRAGEFRGDWPLTIAGSNFAAQVGTLGQIKNTMRGNFRVFGQDFQIPTDGTGRLDPDEDTDAILEHSPQRHDTLEQFQAIMVARLLILNLGTIAQEASSESLKNSFWPSCGFSSIYSTRRFPSLVEGNAGEKGRLQFKIAGCEIINQPAPAFLPDPCASNVRTLVEGTVMLSGTQTIVGEREKIWGGLYDGIIPRHPRAVTLNLTDIRPQNFSSYLKHLGQQVPDVEGRLILQSGKFSAEVEPVIAARKGDQCYFDQPTPVAGFHINNVDNLKVILSLQFRGSSFFTPQTLTINSADLKAHNGFYQGKGNSLGGHIVINGARFEFDENTDALQLDFKQIDFDREYSCRLHTEDDQSIYEVIRPGLDWNPTSTCGPLSSP